MVPPAVDETTELAAGTVFLLVNVDDVALARPRVFASVGHEQNGRGGVPGGEPHRAPAGRTSSR